MRWLAYLLVLISGLGVGCSTPVPQGPVAIFRWGAPNAIVKTKGNYEVATYCFSRAYRGVGCKVPRAKSSRWLCTLSSQVEIAPDQDFGEFYRNLDFDVIFTNTEDGNSEGAVYMAGNSALRKSEARLRNLLEATRECQIKDSPSDEHKDDDTTSESSSRAIEKQSPPNSIAT